MSDLITGPDGLARPPWAATDELLREYYDREWGMPLRDDDAVFERLCLEAFQAGLSWVLVLRRREALRRAFHGFRIDPCAAMSDHELSALQADPGIIRNRLKIQAVRRNALAAQALRDDGGLGRLVWSHQPETTPAPTSVAEVPSTSPESVALSKDLKKRGFTFVGPTTCFALMEAIGVVDTHLVGSHRRGSSGVWAEDGARRPT